MCTFNVWHILHGDVLAEATEVTSIASGLTGQARKERLIAVILLVRGRQKL